MDTELLVNAMLTNDNDMISLFAKRNNGNEITDSVREKISMLSSENQKKISERLEKVLNDCYFNGSEELNRLSEKERFYLKENLIYYLGRISNPDLSLLKKIYSVEKNKHLLLNVAFTSLATGDEEIESDFISRIFPGNEYDNLIRSWTLAFFANAENPYSYIDDGNDDWSIAKNARLKS